jgi:hypothetical protein
LGPFAQPDSLIPEHSQGAQAWDRYAYVNNNPLRYNDPTGHCAGPLLVICVGVPLAGALLILSSAPGDTWVVNNNPTGELQFWSGVSLLAAKFPLAEVASNIYDCSQGFCDPSLMAPGSVSGYRESTEALQISENVTNPLPKTQRFARAVPEDVARKIEAGFTNVTLARPGDPDVFITAAEDLARYRTQSAVESRLALPSGPQRAVVTFKYDWEAGGIASPILRNYPEFIGGGITAGGAREWVIPNRPLSKLLDERLIWDIKVRYLK